MSVRQFFATPIYEASLTRERGFEALNGELEAAALMLAQEDRAGRAWCRDNGYPGYTSYGSLNDLATRAPPFGDLKRRLDRHVRSFADALAYDLGPRGRIVLDSLWVNVLEPKGAHSGHIHPHSVVSGTYYVATPPNSGALRLEDPRLASMMAAPPRRTAAPEILASFVTVQPAAGDVVMWESFVRHEVLAHRGRAPRISVSFNYAWA